MTTKEDLVELETSRKFLRRRITTLCDKIDGEVETYNEPKCIMLKNKLLAYQSEQSELHSEIFRIHVKEKAKDDVLEALIEKYEEYSDRIDESVSHLEVALRSLQGVPSPFPAGFSSTDGGATKLKLPVVDLPTFSNKTGENVNRFIKQFESITAKHKISSHEKFVLLKARLFEAPKNLIDSLEFEEENYEAAKELLEKAFDCTVQAKEDVIRKMASLQLDYKKDPYSYLGEMRSVRKTIDSLKITTDEIIQYFAWNGMNDRFQSHITAITNKSDPSLQEIDDNMYEAIKRYQRQTQKYKDTKRKSWEKSDDSKTVTTMAVDIKQDKSKAANIKINQPKVTDIKTEKWNPKCILCVEDKVDSEHFMSRCKIYDTNTKRVNKLKSMECCIRCGRKNHRTSKCNYEFKTPCKSCSMPHMTYLCLKKPSIGAQITATAIEELGEEEGSELEERIEPEDMETMYDSNLAVVEVAQLSSSDSIVLPTFSAKVVHKDRELQVRIFQDGGSQRTFITKELASKMKLPILEKDISIGINGVVASKSIKTNLVSVPIRLNDMTHHIKAICVDKITTSFRIDGIGEVIKKFIEQGYDIADSHYKKDKNEIACGFGIMLGTDEDYILDMNRRKFGGSEPKSVFIETPIGVMFTGKIDRIISNLDLVPKNQSQDHSAEQECSSNMLHFSENPSNQPELDTKLASEVTEENEKLPYEKLSSIYIETLNMVEDMNRHLMNIMNFYHTEYLSNLVHQTLSEKERFKPKKHQKLKPGDIVLIVEKLHKSNDYPMSKVLSVETNNVGEVTAAQVLRGDTRERVWRHVSALILLIPAEDGEPTGSNLPPQAATHPEPVTERPKRKAAAECLERLSALREP